MNLKGSILFILALICASNANYAGIAVSVDEDVLRNFQSLYMPILIGLINSLEIPDASSKGFTFSNLKIHLDPISPEDIFIDMESGTNSISLTAVNFSGKVTGHMKYLLFSTNFEGDIHKGGATLDLIAILGQQSHNGKALLAMDLTEMQFHLDADLIDLKTSGTLTGDILNLFV